MTSPDANIGPAFAAEASHKGALAAVVRGSQRAAITVVDQGVASVSNFAVGVVVARVAGAGGLGGFSLAYAGWVMLAGLHRSLVTDPMAIVGDARDEGAKAQIRRGFAAEMLLGAAGSAVFATVGLLLLVAGARTFAVGMLAMAPWLPLLVAQDYWRWVGFMSRRPGRSLANDIVYNCVQGAGFAAVLAAHSHSVVLVVAAWGLGAAAGVAFGLRQNRVAPSLRGGAELFRERWSFSKWLVGSSLIATAATQVYQVVVAAILGPVGLGALRAAQNLVMGPAGVLIQAGGSIGLPEASRAYDTKGWPGLMRVCRVVTVAGLLSALGSVAAVAFWGRRLLSVVYGPSFAHLRPVALIIGVGLVLTAGPLGPILVLKATRNTRWLLHVELVFLGMSVTSAAVLGDLYGLDGAAASIGVTILAGLVALRWFQYRVSRSTPGTAPYRRHNARRGASGVNPAAAQAGTESAAPLDVRTSRTTDGPSGSTSHPCLRLPQAQPASSVPLAAGAVNGNAQAHAQDEAEKRNNYIGKASPIAREAFLATKYVRPVLRAVGDKPD